MIKKLDFLHVDTDLWTLKVVWKNWEWRGKKWVRPLWSQDPKLTLSQRAINGINWLLVCCHKFRKAKSSFDNFWVLVFKNVCDLLDLGTLKTALSHELMKWTDFFAKIYSNSYWVGIVKNGWGLIRPYGTLKSRASHKWFDELSRLIKWLLHADNNGDSQSVVSLIFECWGSSAVVLGSTF